MQIRQAKQADESAIKSFGATEWPSVDAEHFGRDNVFFHKKVLKFIAEAHSTIIGYIILEIDMGVCMVDSILIAKSHRGHGVGKALMNTAETAAVAEGCHKLWLVTGLHWDAKDFYESIGYRTLVVLKHHYDGQDFVYMEKLIRTNVESVYN